jgi:ferredoxin-type protein NapG
MDRKDFFKKGIWKAIKGTIETAEDTYQSVTETFTKPKEVVEEVSTIFPNVTKSRKVLRNLQKPPGANTDKKIYEKKCVGCGDCIHACPYNAIFPVYNEKLNKNIAYVDTNNNACLMCSDYPCIAACDHDALKPLKKKTLPKFGKAKLQKDFCINSKTKEYSCNACRTSCPVEGVVSFGKNFLPKFSADCTGCGICVSACPTFPKSILIQ